MMVVNIKLICCAGVQIESVKFFTKIVLTEKNELKIGMEHKVKSLRILNSFNWYIMSKTVAFGEHRKARYNFQLKI